jgi:hypothetical protein
MENPNPTNPVTFYCPRCARHYADLKTFTGHFATDHPNARYNVVLRVPRSLVTVLDGRPRTANPARRSVQHGDA